MLGWHISVYRTPADAHPPASTNTPARTRIGVWQTGLGGLDWIDALIQSGKGRQTKAGGYPNSYLIAASHIVPVILEGPPEARSVWLCEPGAVLNDKWVGKTMIDEVAVKQCATDELLLVEAWDES